MSQKRQFLPVAHDGLSLHICAKLSSLGAKRFAQKKRNMIGTEVRGAVHTGIFDHWPQPHVDSFDSILSPIRFIQPQPEI